MEGAVDNEAGLGLVVMISAICVRVMWLYFKRAEEERQRYLQNEQDMRDMEYQRIQHRREAEQERIAQEQRWQALVSSYGEDIAAAIVEGKVDTKQMKTKRKETWKWDEYAKGKYR